MSVKGKDRAVEFIKPGLQVYQVIRPLQTRGVIGYASVSAATENNTALWWFYIITVE